ncbi:MAG: TonB-dependent receptor [Burkholderiales bacterium]|nr:TonB-dependent receptor [Burkholderiales bacterium]
MNCSGARLACLVALGGLAGAISGTGHAAGFALIEQNASGLGNAYAGAAAAAEDASTIFFNPAGLVFLPGRQLVVAGHAIRPSAEFDNDGSIAGAGKPLGGEGGDAGSWALVPNAYLSWRLTERLAVGVGVNAPFGLKTEYDDDWMGRFQAIESEVKTININPSVAFKVNERLSIGAGLNYQYAEATLTRAVNFGLGGEGKVKVEGEDDDSWGWNAGVIFSATPDLRVGLAYRSAIRHELEGDVTFRRPALVPSAAAPDGPAYARTTLPESASLSVFQRFDDRWDFMGDVTWTNWSRFKTLDIYRANGTLLQSTPENWDDSWRISFGLSYRLNDAWKLRGGVAYDETPVPDDFRTARIPDNSRTWVAFGAQWKPRANLAVDFGYAHLFIPGASIDDNQTPVNGRLRGEYDSSVDILSAQVTYSF